MTFDIQTPLPEPTVQFEKAERFGEVLEIAFPVTNTVSSDTPVLVITPSKTP